MDYGYLDFVRNNSGRSGALYGVYLCGLFLVCLIIDPLRIVYLLTLSSSGNGKKLMLVSNQNQVVNINKYVSGYSKDFTILFIKSSLAFRTFPQAYFHFRALLKLVGSSGWIRKYSYLDIDLLRYSNSSRYISVFLRLLRTESVIISREDISPYLDVAEASQKLGLKLTVIEHGILTSPSYSFVPTKTTLHVFSSPLNIDKRQPPPVTIFKAESPLQQLFKAVSQIKINESHDGNELILADTLNIRSRLLEIASILEKDFSVNLRPHPGVVLSINNFIDKRPKFEAMRNANLVVTGISGFAMETVFCGIPTIVLVTPEDEWCKNDLASFNGIHHVRVVQIDEFLAEPKQFITSVCQSNIDTQYFQKTISFEGQLSHPEVLRNWFA